MKTECEFDKDYVNTKDLEEFEKILNIPDVPEHDAVEYITALNDWQPVYEKTRRKMSKSSSSRKLLRDETGEGVTYSLVRWPVLVCCSLKKSKSPSS